jgi:hypothetical protein
MRTYRLQSRTADVVGLILVVALAAAPLMAVICGAPSDDSRRTSGSECVIWALVMSAWAWLFLTLPYAAELRGDGLFVLHRLRGDAEVVVSQITLLHFLERSRGRNLSLWIHAPGSRVFLAAAPATVHGIARDIVECNPSVRVQDGSPHWPWSRPTTSGMDRLRELADC